MLEKYVFPYIRKWCVVGGLCLAFPWVAYAQQQKISLNIQNVTLKQAMEQIKEQAVVNVAYSKEFVDPNKTVSLKVENVSLQTALTQLFKGTDVGFRFLDNSVLLYNQKEQDSSGAASKEQQIVSVKGTVVDQVTGEPIIGASVAVEGSSKGTSTDLDGKYSLSAPVGSTLKFSYVGYKETKKEVLQAGVLDVSLMESSVSLDDVVVVGYGVQKKVNVTGAVSMVKGDELENRPVANVSAGLQGLLPGVSITSSSGQPGAVPSITVRGVSTINSSTAPLILIDGVSGGDLNLLNPNDVESVSVLKDAASAAIYGARAANGVILITTKQGKRKEKATLTYSGYVGMQTPTALPELVTGRQYMDLANEAMAAAGFSRPYDATAFEKYDSGMYPNEYSNTDWVNEIFKKHALQTSHSVSVRGGSEKSSYFMSYGYLDQDGLVVGDAFKTKRHNARINVNTEVFDRLKINGNVSFVDYYRNASGFSGTGGVFRLAQRMSPLLPVKWQQQNEMGLWEDTEYWSSGSINNPVYVATEGGEEKRKSRTLNTIVSADLRIIDGLNLGGQYAANYYFRETDKFTPTLPEYFSDGTPDPANKNMRNSVSQAHQDALTQTLQLTLNFQKQINKHEIGALLGYSQEWYNFSSLSASRKKIPFDGIYVIDAGTEDITNSGTKSSWALRSYFGRVNYAFDGKYLVEANMRIDGTSRFARDNRWGYFPSFSAGWNFSREEFMQFAEPVLSSGKLRASWGELGNQNVGSDYYPYLTPIDSGESYPIGGKQNIGFQQSKLGNANIKWETIRMLNVGVDLTFFNNRLTASFDWFKKDNIDALVKPVYPTVVGITGTANLPYENMGKIENKGWELEIGWRDQIGEVKYNLLFNLSDAKNKIVDLGTSEPRLTNNIRREGDPIDAYYGYLTDGLAQIDDFGGVDSNGKYINPKFAIPKAAEAITQPGDIKYRDISGPGGIPDGEIDEYDKVVFGDPYPHYSYSLRGQLQWRDWDFSFYFQGVGKVNGYLSDEARHCFINDYSIPKVEHLDRWTPNNPDATYPRLYQAQSHNLLFSDYWKEDASYLRLKNVQLGYSIPKKLLNRWKIEGLRLYASADNLLTFTKYFGAYDPEVRESSGDVYPQVKTYVFGLVLSF